MSRFLTDTAVEALGDGRYAAHMDRGWWIVNGPNGGFVAAVVARAMTAEAVERRPEGAETPFLHSLSVHYLRPPVEGPVVIDVTVERAGRSVATVTARMTQADTLVAVAVAAVAASRPGREFDELVRPEAPEPEAVPAPVVPEGTPMLPMTARYDMRPCLGSATGEWGPQVEPRPAVSGGWLRFSDGAPIDAIALTAMTDAWIPPAMHKFPGEPLLVPTVDLTVHVRALPVEPTDWVLVRFRSPFATGGYLVEDGEIWDRHGNLLAVSRQLAVVV